MADKLPAMPLYTGDWFKDPTLRSLKPDIRGLYVDLLMYMWNSSERGVLIDEKGNPFSEDDVINLVGLDNQNSSNWLTTLLTKGVISKRDEDGAIYSRRMIKDEEKRIKRQTAGKMGGNPDLLKYKDKQITENENEYENEIENKDKKKVPTDFDKQQAQWWKKRIENDKDAFRSVEINLDKFANDIRLLRTSYGLSEDEILTIQDYLSNPETGDFIKSENFWYDKIGTPEKLKEKSPKAKKRYYAMVLRDAKKQSKRPF